MREAGGLVDAIAQGRDPLEAGDLVCANADIYDTFVKAIRGT